MAEAPLFFENPIRDAISSVRFAPSSDNLLISSWDSSLRLYDVGGSALRLESRSESPLLDCCFETESVAFSASSDDSIRRYDLNTGSNEVIEPHNDEPSTCIRYSDETRRLFMAGLHRKILAWDTRMGTAEKGFLSLVDIGEVAESMSVSGFDLTVAVGTSVHIYDLRNLSRLVKSKKCEMGIRIQCLSSVAHCRGFAVGSVDGRVGLEMYPSDSKEIRYMFRCHPKSRDKRCHLVSVNDIAFNPLRGSAFFTGDNDGYVISWDAESRKRLYELPRFPNSVASLAINQSGQLLAIASSFTYQEANEKEELPQIFIHEVDNDNTGSASSSSSRRY